MIFEFATVDDREVKEVGTRLKIGETSIAYFGDFFIVISDNS